MFDVSSSEKKVMMLLAGAAHRLFVSADPGRYGLNPRREEEKKKAMTGVMLS